MTKQCPTRPDWADSRGQSFLKEHHQIQFKGDCSWSALANEVLPSTTRRARAFDTLAAREQAVVADAVEAAYSET
jgi:hypothetical protein